MTMTKHLREKVEKAKDIVHDHIDRRQRARDRMLGNWQAMNTVEGRLEAYEGAVQKHKQALNWLHKAIKKCKEEIHAKAQ